MGQSTTTTNAYQPGSYSTYGAFQPQIQSSLQQMVQNPLGSSYFHNQLAQQQAAGQQLGQRNISNIASNLRAGGGILSNSGAFSSAQINRGMIANSGMQSNAFNSAVNSALSNRNIALAAMQAYQPLQTGQTQSTSGMGSWLGPIAGAALNMVTPGIGSLLGGGSFRGGYQVNPMQSNPASRGSGGSGSPTVANANPLSTYGGQISGPGYPNSSLPYY